LILAYGAVKFFVASFFEKRPAIVTPDMRAAEILGQVMIADGVTKSWLLSALQAWKEPAAPTLVDLAGLAPSGGMCTRLLIEQLVASQSRRNPERMLFRYSDKEDGRLEGYLSSWIFTHDMANEMSLTLRGLVLTLATAPATASLIAKIRFEASSGARG